MEHLREQWRRIAQRCTDASFEAITGQCPTEEILDGGHLLEMLTKAGFGYEVLGPVAPTVRAFVALPEYQTGSYYLFTSGHALAFVDGALTDTEGRGADGRRILGVYRITRKVSAAAYPKTPSGGHFGQAPDLSKVGLREEAEDDGDAFWYQVYGEVMA